MTNRKDDTHTAILIVCLYILAMCLITLAIYW